MPFYKRFFFLHLYNILVRHKILQHILDDIKLSIYLFCFVLTHKKEGWADIYM